MIAGLGGDPFWPPAEGVGASSTVGWWESSAQDTTASVEDLHRGAEAS